MNGGDASLNGGESSIKSPPSNGKISAMMMNSTPSGHHLNSSSHRHSSSFDTSKITLDESAGTVNDVSHLT